MSKLIFNQIETTPASQPTGAVMVYAKSDGGLYYKNASNDEVQINTGAADANNIIRTNEQTISDNITVAANKNGFTAGPITISSGTSVTISSGANRKIV